MASQISSVYRCSVPGCRNMSVSAPDKSFFSIPTGKRRIKWDPILKRVITSISSRGNRCCQDHANFEEDSVGTNKRAKKWRHDLLPYIITCQPDRNQLHLQNDQKKLHSQNDQEQLHSQNDRPAAEKRRRVTIVTQLLNPTDQPSRMKVAILPRTRKADSTNSESNLSSLETSDGRTDVKSETLSSSLEEESEFLAKEHLSVGHGESIESSQPSQASDFATPRRLSQDVDCKQELDFEPWNTQECVLEFEKEEEIVDSKTVMTTLNENDAGSTTSAAESSTSATESATSATESATSATESATSVTESATYATENATSAFGSAIDYDEVDLMNLFEDVGSENKNQTKGNENLSLVVSESGELIGIEADGILHRSDRTPTTETISDRPNQRKVVTGTSFSRPHSCKICLRRFRFSSELKEHSRDHASKIIYSCDDCLASFKSKAKLRSHFKEQSCEGKRFACDQCPQKFSHANSLKRHLCLHSPSNIFSCNECSAEYRQKRSLEAHLKTHAASKTYSCPHCPQKFRINSSLQRHLKKHDNKSAHVCSICSAKFWQKFHLKNHLMMHKGDRPFTCAHCPAKFSRKGNLSRHIKDVHFSAQEYLCNQCSRSFSHSSSLKRHLEKHNKENPFKCTYCPMKFKEVRRLRSHLALHLRKDSFSCEHCPAQFIDKKELRRHMSIHFKDLCDEIPESTVKFDCSDEFKRHVHTQGGKGRTRKRFFCTLCPASYTSNKALKKHLAKHAEGKFSLKVDLREKFFFLTDKKLS